jgi:hypothetical protein
MRDYSLGHGFFYVENTCSSKLERWGLLQGEKPPILLNGKKNASSRKSEDIAFFGLSQHPV